MFTFIFFAIVASCLVDFVILQFLKYLATYKTVSNKWKGIK